MEYTNNPITITVTGITRDGEDTTNEKIKDFDKTIKEIACKGFALIAFRDSEEGRIDCSVVLHECSVAMLASVFADSEALSCAARVCTLKSALGGMLDGIGKH